ncbi:type II secretion system F family protein [Mordavella massiliensis]|uniref:Type II secretion system F family protein n=1 Tax=Mordavella massiliensis TaxID=1871024 RepID=A0A938XAT8_9CLOT|nr:type II secretion system F family protein [Mordavella massiliensis]MBM6948061.1 type II secretion system F family protein [Mordavella massiliensis]
MKALTNPELISFCRQAALLLRSGISAAEGLYLMAEDTPQEEGKELLSSLSRELEQTGSLAGALQAAAVFPSYMCAMVRIGEETGRLDDVMEALARHFEREDRLSRNIRSAVSYPLAMIGMMLAVIVILLVKVMPVFQQVFSMLGVEMDGVSGALLEFAYALRNYSAVILLFVLAVCLVFFCLFFTRTGRSRLLAFSHRFILTRRLSRKIAGSRFAAGMSLCLASGLNVEQSLELTAPLIAHPEVRGQIEAVRQAAASGESFADAVSASGIFPSIYARMLSIGARAGASDEVMRQIADRCADEIDESLDSIVSKLEPTLVAILSVAVGMILLSVMLPLMGVMTGIG